MKASEFCYWLQGFFELGDVHQLSKRQVEIISLHLKLVDIHDKTDGRSKQFCSWLSGAIELFGELEFSAQQTVQVKKVLSEVFKHEIDPSYPSEEIDQLNQIHEGWGSSPNSGMQSAPRTEVTGLHASNLS